MRTILAKGRQGAPLRVVTNQTGTPTYAADLAAAVADIVLSGHWSAGIFNYSNEGVASWYDFAVAILETAGMREAADAVVPVMTSDYPHQRRVRTMPCSTNRKSKLPTASAFLIGTMLSAAACSASTSTPLTIMANLNDEISRRRTFAIISHPDAGQDNAHRETPPLRRRHPHCRRCKSNKIKKTATSDWMEIEKQRGISVATSVMGFNYGDYKINILDTPGHRTSPRIPTAQPPSTALSS